MTEEEVPDVLSPAALLFVRLCLEDERLSLPAQLEACWVARNVLIESKVASLEGE